MAPNKMQDHFWHLFLTQLFILFHMVACILFSMAAPIIAYFKDSDWLLEEFWPIRKWSWTSWKRLTREVQKQVSKAILHFVWGHISKKQTVIRTPSVPELGFLRLPPCTLFCLKTNAAVKDFFRLCRKKALFQFYFSLTYSFLLKRVKWEWVRGFT